MCIVVVKPAGHALPTWATLENCFDGNPDGAGFMYNDKGLVHIRKGFMDWNDFKRAFKAEKKQFDWKESAIVFHFRIKTHGEVSRECCHPFPIVADLKRLRKTDLVCRYGIAHNGVLAGYHTDARTSDTMAYIMNVVAPCIKMCDNIEDKNMDTIIRATVQTSKLALLDGSGTVKMYGTFIEEDGVYYSNRSYEDWGIVSYTSPFYTNVNNRTAITAYKGTATKAFPKWAACKRCGWETQCKAYGADCFNEKDAQEMASMVNESEKGECWSHYPTKHANDYGYDYSAWGSDW